MHPGTHKPYGTDAPSQHFGQGVAAGGERVRLISSFFEVGYLYLAAHL
jgi:hypothetical protein